MNLRLTSAIAVAKITILLLRLVKRGGTTLPGKIAGKICPGIAGIIGSKFKVIMVTGTNGKTTTTRIIGRILEENGIPYITNRSGANLVSGVTTTFIESVNLRGISKCSTALIEIDEAAFKSISNHLNPDILVVNNFFRDQLDRYGELYTTLKGVKAGLEQSSKTRLILNADDSLCASLGQDYPREILYFGFDSHAHSSMEEGENSDASFCIYCKTRYQYENHVYGHLGGFLCPSCGYRKPATGLTCCKVEELTTTYSDIRFSIGEDCSKNSYHAKVNLPGLYNIYNALAALSCAVMLELDIEKSIGAVASFQSGFGRMESIPVDGRNIRLILVKNPTGFNQVLNFLLTEEGSIQLAFILNDNLADGTDISWLWDVDFEKLAPIDDRIESLYASGVRGEDMALRLKYAGLSTGKMSIVKDYDRLLDEGLASTPMGGTFYILPTYTAMLDIRETLSARYGLKAFWK